MLIQCPECGLQASDKALSCPHCGYPFQQNTSKPKIRKSNRKRRLPNGFGQITEIKGRNLRKPFRAMITVGKNINGRPICKLLEPNAYFTTYNEAYEALVKYNKNPYDIDGITIQELYDRWSNEYFESTSESSQKAVKAAWKYCSSVYDMKIPELRIKHIRYCMEEGTAVVHGKEKKASAQIKLRIRQNFSMMLDYAINYELIDKNYARMLTIPKSINKDIEENKKQHITFTDAEIQILWDNLYKVPNVDLLLINCYTGFRPQEMCKIEIENVSLEENYIIEGIKTAAGKGRYVPIHPKIKELVEKRYNESTDGKLIPFTYPMYRDRFLEVINALDLNQEHRPHDCRKHFVTLAKKAKMDEYALKYIVGHVIKDITEKVYTERDPAWLQQEMQKIK